MISGIDAEDHALIFDMSQADGIAEERMGAPLGQIASGKDFGKLIEDDANERYAVYAQTYRCSDRIC